MDRDGLWLAAELRKTPAEIDAMPYLDSISLLNTFAERLKRETEWQAALHGKTLKR